MAMLGVGMEMDGWKRQIKEKVDGLREEAHL